MSDINMEYFKDLLLKRGAELKHTLHTMNENNTASQDMYEPTELSNYDNHPAEIASELYLVEMNNALRVHEEHLLREIHNAIGRIDDGTYGKCTFCGKEIDKSRLEAIPYARLCMDCEENKAVDSETLTNMRPNEELIYDAPFGRKHLNSREDDEYEGIDYLNDLMKYGSSDGPQDLGGYNEYEEFYTNKVDKQGVVDKMDNISNKEYKKQLPD